MTANHSPFGRFWHELALSLRTLNRIQFNAPWAGAAKRR